MHWFKQHIGDHAAKAGHLSMLEEGAYRRLLDAYYVREKPLPLEVEKCCRLVRATTDEERAAVAYVLPELFQRCDEGWRDASADEVIAKYSEKSQKAKRSANARWNAKRTDSERNANASETHSDGNANQEPRTNNASHSLSVDSETDVSGEAEAPPTPADLIFGLGVGLLTKAGVADKQARAVLGKVRKVVGDEKAAALVAQASATVPALTDPQAWLMAAARGGGESEAERRMRLRREAMI